MKVLDSFSELNLKRRAGYLVILILRFLLRLLLLILQRFGLRLGFLACCA